MPSTLESEGTILTITPLSGAGALLLAPYSARGLTQTLKQFGGEGGGFIREDIFGETVNLTPEWMKKYISTISCTDIHTPCLDNAFRGKIVQVDCCIELNYQTGGMPNRPVVSGSSREEGGFTYYRPSLIMMVIDIDTSFVEWHADYVWRVDLREMRVPTV